MRNPFGYRHGAIGDYTGGDPAEARVAWKALDYEFRELGNSYLLTDVARFLGIEPTSWTDVITKFRKRYGNISGTWLVRNKKNLHLYRDYGDIGKWKYDKDKVLTGYGDEDGFFVIGAKEVEMNPIRRNIMNYPIASIKNMKKFEKMGKRVVAFSPFTGEQYSTTPGDYWQYPDTYVLKDSGGDKMYLGMPTSGMRRPNPRRTKRKKLNTFICTDCGKEKIESPNDIVWGDNSRTCSECANNNPISNKVRHFYGRGLGWEGRSACGMFITPIHHTTTNWKQVTCKKCLSTKHR